MARRLLQSKETKDVSLLSETNLALGPVVLVVALMISELIKSSFFPFLIRYSILPAG